MPPPPGAPHSFQDNTSDHSHPPLLHQIQQPANPGPMDSYLRQAEQAQIRRENRHHKPIQTHPGHGRAHQLAHSPVSYF